MGKTIVKSVGVWDKGAKNDPSDVVLVQTLLQAAAKETENPEFDPKGVDGKIGKVAATSSTIKAIRAFQRTFMTNSDGLVEPGKTTIQKLGAYLTDIPGPVPGNMPEAPIKNSGDCFFPLGYVPKYDYHTGGRRFGASRSSGTRLHAGCDLIAPQGTPIHAVAKGVISRGPYYFYHGTYAVEVDHGDFVARYCEIKSLVKGLKAGSEVEAGQHIATVGKMYNSAMLHFELYGGSASGPLTQSRKPYKRRSDLLDPTPYLDLWSTNLPVAQD